VLPRRSVFRRTADTPGAVAQVVAANIDTVLLCDAIGGTLSHRHLERFLALAWQSGATPVVVMTKSDAAEASVVAAAVEAVKAVAADVAIVVLSATTGEGVENLAPYLVEGRTVALIGLSGAGKSTLLNVLSGAELLATGAVRADGKGRHTTTHRELVKLRGGGLVIDTPGMRALSVAGAAQGVEAVFDDLAALAERCAYPDCSHTGEAGCAVAAAVERGEISPDRVESWLRLRAEPGDSDHEAAQQQVAERKRRKAAKFVARRARRA
jgi:ribosome biogenesis GTPase